MFAQDILGTGPYASGLACTPTSPASLSVNIAPGRLYSVQNVDTTAYSTLGTNSTQITKQGISAAVVQLACAAPVTPGYSVNFLLEATYADSDTGLTVLPYYNAANPASAWSGPGNSGASQPTARQGIITLQAKPGIAAATGTQTTPAPDAGYVGLWVVTVAYGATQILSGNITQAPGAPFFTTLPNVLTTPVANGIYLQLIGRTPAETLVNVTPTNTGYPEGDLRRYGCVANNSATAVQTANAIGINAAFLVSAAGGSPVFVPPGTWYYNAMVSTGNATYGASSIYGAGRLSQLSPATGIDGLTFVGDAASGASASRFFRDFTIIGPSTTSSNNSGILIPNSIANRISGISFSNLTIQNFGYGVNCQSPSLSLALWQSMFVNCFVFNCYYGYRFSGGNITNVILGGFVQNNTMGAPAGAPYAFSAGISCDYNAPGNTQGLVVHGVNVYNFGAGFYGNLFNYLCITDCEFQACGQYGLWIGSQQGGTFVRGCNIQALAGANNYTAVFLNDQGTPLYDKVVFESNQLVGSSGTGTVGFYIGGQQNGVTLRSNTIGQGLGGTPFVTGVTGAAGNGVNGTDATIIDNTIYATTTAINLYVGAQNATVGPNKIQNGTPLVLTGGTPPGLNYTHNPTPMRGTVTVSNVSTIAITFAVQMPSAGYQINLSPSAQSNPWWSGKSQNGFTINFSAPFTGSVDWSISL